jgi:hypothetical protein
MKTAAESGRRRRLVSSSETSDVQEWVLKSVERRRCKIVASPGCFIWPQISSSNCVSTNYPSTIVVVDKRTSFHSPLAQTRTQAYCFTAVGPRGQLSRSCTVFSVIGLVPQLLQLREEQPPDTSSGTLAPRQRDAFPRRHLGSLCEKL